jgi:tetratricopeptide (TPR) repeat protein
MRFRPAIVVLALATLAPPLAAESPVRSETLSPAESARRDAVERFLRARLFAADGEFQEALKEFRRAVELDPEDGHLRREYAEALRDFGILPEAEEQARKAVVLVPENAAAHRVLGQILLSKSRGKEGIEAALPDLKKANDLQPAEPSGAVALGQAYLRLDRPKEAAAVLARVQDGARGPMLALLYGEALEKSDRPEEAEAVYQGVLRIDEENAPANLGLLRVYQATRRFDKALPILAQLVERQPGNLGLKAQYGFALLRARRLDEAEAAFQEVLKADPDNRDALRHYSTLLSERLETERADDLLKRLQGLEPDDADVAFRRALNFLEARRLDEAETVLRDLRSTLVAQKAPAAGIASVDGQLGYVALLRKDWPAARAAVRPHLIEEDGTVNLQALNLLAQVARDADDPAEGLKACREAFAKQPKELAVRSLLAEFLLRSTKEKEKAEGEELVAAIAKDGRAGALAAADVWQRLEKYGRAADAASAALAQFPDDPDLLFRKAASLEREKKVPESVAAFERLLELKPDHGAALNYLGYMYADRNENLDRALELVTKAVSLEPSNAAYLDSLGWIYFRLGRMEEAEKSLLTAKRLSPDDPTIEDHLGDLEEKRGNVAKARERWTRALALEPEDGGAAIRAKLDRTASAAKAP